GFGPASILYAQAALERDRLGESLDCAAIGAAEDDVPPIRFHAGSIKNLHHGHASPLRGTDGAEVPLFSAHARLQHGTAVSSALQGHQLRFRTHVGNVPAG